MPISETGHAVNLANTKTMIDYATTFAGDYQPNNAALSVANLTTMWTAGNTAHTTLTTAMMNAKGPMAARKTLFKPLDKLITRTLGSYDSTEADEQLKSNARSIADRIRGTVKVDKNTNVNNVSVSHQSYVQKADAFQQLIALYKSDVSMAPNEGALTTATLETLLTDMKKANEDIGLIIAPVDTALIARNEGIV